MVETMKKTEISSNVIVRANVSRIVEETGIKFIDSEAFVKLNDNVVKLIKDACKRTKANSRRVLKERDI